MTFSFKVGTVAPISNLTHTQGGYGKPRLYRVVSANLVRGTKADSNSPLIRLELVLNDPNSDSTRCDLIYSNIVNSNGQRNELGQGLLQALGYVAGLSDLQTSVGGAKTYRNGDIVSVDGTEHFSQLQGLLFGGVITYAYEDTEQYGFYFDNNGVRKISTKNQLRVIYNPTTLLTDVDIMAGKEHGTQENIDNLAQKAVEASHYHLAKFLKAFSYLLPLHSDEVKNHANWVGFDLSTLDPQMTGNPAQTPTYNRNSTPAMPQGQGYPQGQQLPPQGQMQPNYANYNQQVHAYQNQGHNPQVNPYHPQPMPHQNPNAFQPVVTPSESLNAVMDDDMPF